MQIKLKTTISFLALRENSNVPALIESTVGGDMRHTIQEELMAESQNRNLSVRLDSSRLSFPFMLPENFTNAISKARRIVHIGAGNLL